MQRQAFGEIAGKGAAGLELLQLGQRPLDQRQGAAQPLGELGEIAGDVAGGIEHIDDLQADDALGRVGDVEMKLGLEVLAQGGCPLRRLLDAVLAVADPTERIIGLQIIDMLDPAGYVGSDLATLAERLSCPLALVEATLAKLQQFEPCGVFARHLAECLALQLKERDRLDPAMQMLLKHLDLLAKHDRNQLMRLCGVDAEDLADMVSEIRALDPKPGLSFETAEVETVIPDILVSRRADGSWSVELNADTLPRLLVNQQYHALVSAKAQSKAEKDYLTDRLAAANWLVKTLHQRATTILKVASEIIRQ